MYSRAARRPSFGIDGKWAALTLAVIVIAISGFVAMDHQVSRGAAPKRANFQTDGCPATCGGVRECELGAAVGTEWYWVPELVISAPFTNSATAMGGVGSSVGSQLSLGLAGDSGTWSTDSGSVTTINVNDGVTEGLFELTEFTVYDAKGYFQQGGTAHPCTQAYLAAPTDFTSWTQTYNLTTAESCTCNIPDSVSITVHGSQTGLNGQSVPTISGLSGLNYQSGDLQGFSDCGADGESYAVTQSEFAETTWGIDLGATYDGVTVGGAIAWSSISGDGTSFTYSFPDNSGEWDFDTTTGQSHSELAFSWSSCSGGGGCVAWGTPILTSEGYVPIQNLQPGDEVQEYNFTQGRLVPGTLLTDNQTTVKRLIDINNGQLFLTPTEQPILIYNSTFTGWLHDPRNLTSQDYYFDPVTGEWDKVFSIHFVNRLDPVFDVVTSGPNDFVANGALLDKKAP